MQTYLSRSTLRHYLFLIFALPFLALYSYIAFVFFGNVVADTLVENVEPRLRTLHNKAQADAFLGKWQQETLRPENHQAIVRYRYPYNKQACIYVYYDSDEQITQVYAPR